MNDQARQALCEIVARYGRGVSDEPRRVQALLSDLCPGMTKEVSVLVTAAERGVPQEAASSSPQLPPQAVVNRATRRLVDETGLTEEAARWAVESWAVALGVVVAGGAYGSATLPVGAAPSGAAWGSGPAAAPHRAGRRRQLVGYLLLILLVGAGAGLVVWTLLRNGGGDRAATADALPPELDRVPRDAVAFVSVRPAQYIHTDFAHAYHEMLGRGRGGGHGLPDLMEEYKRSGLPLEDLDRVTVVVPEWSREKGPEYWFLYAASKPFDRSKVLEAMGPDAKVRQYKDKLLYSYADGDLVVYFVSDRLLAVGSDSSLFGEGSDKWRDLFVEGPPAQAREGPLSDGLQAAAGDHLLTAAVNGNALPDWMKNGQPADAPGAPDFKPYLPLLQLRKGILTLDAPSALRLDLQMTFPDDAQAQAGRESVKAALNRFRQAAADWAFQPPSPAALAELDAVDAALHQVQIDQHGPDVKVHLETDAWRNALTLYLHLTPGPREDLKKLAEAAIAYSNAVDTGLPSAVEDKDGKPLLSWRVLLLPYLGEDDLYKEFRLDEPWDSDHNMALLEKMPAVFATPKSEAFWRHETYYQAFVGEGGIFYNGPAGPAGTFKPSMIFDGTSNTILFAEAAKSVPWTKPEDMPFDKGDLRPRLGGLSRDGFCAVMCDGTVHFVPSTAREDTLHALVTPNGGEVVDEGLDK